MSEATYSYARAHLAELWDRAVDDCEPVVITRRGAEDVVLVSAAEFRDMTETLRLLASPANGVRLLTALARANAGTEPATDLTKLVDEFGLGNTMAPRTRNATRRTAS